MKLTSFIFLFEEQSIFDINVFNYFKYLYVGFKRKSYFIKKKKEEKRMMTFLSKYDKKMMEPYICELTSSMFLFEK